MKSKLILMTLLISINAIAQNGINYKALIKDANGNVLTSSPTSIQFIIYEGSALSNNVYQENHTITTDANGFVIVNIGEGTTGDDFNEINWENDEHYLNVQVDIGSGLVDLGTTQFMQVPYALLAKKASNVTGLEYIDESGNQGWRLIGRNPDNYEDIGNNAIDFSLVNDSNLGQGATGNYAFSHGQNGTASGEHALAFGNQNYSLNDYAIAMGNNNNVSGLNSTAIGAINQVNGDYAFATGLQNQASGNNSVAIGNATEASGYASVAIGIETIASGYRSTALGSGTTSSANGSTALGFNTTASANGSTAIGELTLASNSSATAMGFNTSAIGSRSTTMGSNTTASEFASTAMGESTEASGNTSTAMGNYTNAIGERSLAMGNYTNAIGYISTAMGNSTNASGSISTAMGNSTNASGDNSTAIGYYTDASGLSSIATGHASDATGEYSTAMGYRTTASGNSSTTLGVSTTASAFSSIAIGNASIASGDFSIAIGGGLRTESEHSTALGRFNVGGGDPDNWISTDPLFEIGNGTNTNRRNAITILKNGNIGIDTDTPDEKLHITNGRLKIGTETIEDGGNNALRFNASLLPDNNNVMSLGNSSLRWTGLWATDGTINTSDRREKKNIKDLQYGLNEVLQMQPVSYNWKNKNNPDTKIGLIAQDLQNIVPEVVKSHTWEKDEISGQISKIELERLGVYYADLVPVLIRAIQEQNEIINNQDRKFEALLSRIELLEAEISN